MFGQPEWFREKEIGWGLVPVTWQGWVYVLLWCATMLAPFAALLAIERPWEGALWLAISAGVMLGDVWMIVAALRAPKLPIASSELPAHRSSQVTASASGSTKYDLYIK